jgi:apolipoprotein D and lipocalin family protein
MKKAGFIVLLFISSLMNAQTLPGIDANRYEGDWYVIGFKPSWLDKNWIDTREHYDWNADAGRFDIVAHYRTEIGGKEKTKRQRLLPVKNSHNSKWIARIGLFIRADYFIYKIADDYSYVVVGHPKHKYLYIMARKPSMDEDLYMQLVDFASTLGYAREEIVKHVQETVL